MEPSTHARALYRAHLTNPELQTVIVAVARASGDVVRWPRGLCWTTAPVMCHQYVQERTRYSAEDHTQQVRTPWAFVEEKVGDCKSTAVFIGALCKAAGWPVRLRFVRYAGAEHFGHVYAVVGGLPYDPLLPIGAECVHLQAKDFAI